MPVGNELFKTGMLIMGATFVICLLFAVGSLITGKKLKRKLEREYGPKRH